MFKLKTPRAPTWRHALPSYLRRNITSFGMAGSTRKVGGCSKIAAAAQPALLALVLFLPASNAAFCTEGTYFPISNRGRCDASFYHPSDDDVGDPVCVTCPDDTYMNEKKHCNKQCFKKKDQQCAANQYIDTTCTTCESTVANDWPCAPKTTTCDDGEDLDKSGTSTTTDDWFCKLTPTTCDAGEYVDESNGCSACPSGKYMSKTTHQETSCVPKSVYTCSRGQSIVDNGATSNDKCVGCPMGQYRTDFRHAYTSCVPKTKCNTGQYRHNSPSTGGYSISADDWECRACATNTYQDATDHSNTICKAKTASTCGRGQYYDKGDSKMEDDWGCKSCEKGSYRPDDDHAHQACLPKTQFCADPKKLDDSGTSLIANDWACTLLAIGTKAPATKAATTPVAVTTTSSTTIAITTSSAVSTATTTTSTTTPATTLESNDSIPDTAGEASPAPQETSTPTATLSNTISNTTSNTDDNNNNNNTPNPNTNAASGKQSSGGAVAGAVVGTFLLLAVGAFVWTTYKDDGGRNAPRNRGETLEMIDNPMRSPAAAPQNRAPAFANPTFSCSAPAGSRMQQQQQQRPATVALTANVLYEPAMNNAYDAGVGAHGPAIDSNVVYAVAIDAIDDDSGGSAAYNSIYNGDADGASSNASAHYDIADHGTGASGVTGAYGKLSARPQPGSGSGSGSGGYETSA